MFGVLSLKEKKGCWVYRYEGSNSVKNTNERLDSQFINYQQKLIIKQYMCEILI